MTYTEIQLEMLRQLLEEVKALKSDYIVIRDGIAIGTDQNCIFVKYVKLKLDYSKCIVQGFNYKEAVTFLKEIEGSDYLNIYNSVIVNETKSSAIGVADPRVDDAIWFVYNNTKNSTNGIVPIERYLTDDVLFNKAISGKTGDGCTAIYINNYPISIYSSLLPINKNDKVSVNIYDNKLEPTFIAEFIIEKKKNVIITALIRYLKI